MCSIPTTWIYPTKSDALIDAVTDVRSDHQRALTELTVRLRPSNVCERDQAKQPLSDLLLGRR